MRKTKQPDWKKAWVKIIPEAQNVPLLRIFFLFYFISIASDDNTKSVAPTAPDSSSATPKEVLE